MQGKQIVQHGPRDFDATFDGNYIGSFKSRPEARRALNDYVLGLCEQGLVDLPLAAMAEQALTATCELGGAGGVPDGTPSDEYPDVPAGNGEPTYCATCNGSGLIPSNGCGDACGGWAEHCPDCRNALAVA